MPLKFDGLLGVISKLFPVKFWLAAQSRLRLLRLHELKGQFIEAEALINSRHSFDHRLSIVLLVFLGVSSFVFEHVRCDSVISFNGFIIYKAILFEIFVPFRALSESVRRRYLKDCAIGKRAIEELF